MTKHYRYITWSCVSTIPLRWTIRGHCLLCKPDTWRMKDGRAAPAVGNSPTSLWPLLSSISRPAARFWDQTSRRHPPLMREQPVLPPSGQPPSAWQGTGGNTLDTLRHNMSILCGIVEILLAAPDIFENAQDQAIYGGHVCCGGWHENPTSQRPKQLTAVALNGQIAYSNASDA